MTERRLHAQVGLLFLLSVTVLVLGILWFKEFQIRGRTFKQTIEFQSTSGLVKGDPVEVKGVPSGKVEDIQFEEGLALVSVQLDRKVKLYQDAQFSIESVGIMGQKMVSIFPGTRQAGEMQKDAIPKGVYRGGTTEIMNGVADALEIFQRIASRVDTLVAGFSGGDGKQKQFGQTLDNLERASRDLSTLLEENRKDINESVRNMNAAMNDIHGMLEGKEEKFGETLDQAHRASARLDTTLVGLQVTIAKMDTLLTQVQSGQGTLGKLAQDEELYKQFVATLEDAKALLADVRQNPKRYFKFSVF
jgi:phospholipid/cholesterol/gamma-HCH transport system substrate-binding protein